MGDECPANVNGSSSQNESGCTGLQCPESRPPPYPVRKLESCSCAAVAPKPSAALAPKPSDSTFAPRVSGETHSYKSGAYLLWPGNDQLLASADERAACFGGPQKPGGVMNNDGEALCGNQASTLLELMTIRAYHSKSLRSCGLGTALGFRTRRGVLTSIPAIIVFVARKLHTQWLHEMQILPSTVSGPGGIWCDIDVVEFSYGVPAMMPKEQIFSEVLDGLRGMDATIGSGTQVASQETYGTLGAVVQSQIGARELGFITNRHVAVDLDYPSQRMFHPLPPNLGPGVYLGAVKRATSFVKDDLWYGVFAGVNPETFVRADGAFIPFCETFDISKVATSIRGVGTMGEVYRVDLQSKIGSIVGRQVVKVGRSSGVTKGAIMGYAVEYNDENGVCFLTDFLIVGENNQSFDLEGDSGSLILLTHDNDEQNPQPVGLIWGGTANRGRLKLRNEHGPENWTSGVDLGRLLDILQLDIIKTDKALQEAVLLQERVECASMISSPRWLAKDRVPDPVSSPPQDEPAQDPEQAPNGVEDGEEDEDEEEEPETSSPAAKDLISSSSIGNFPLRRDVPRPSLDLADEDLSMRLSGPSSSGTLHPNPHTAHENAAPNLPDSVHDRTDPHELDTVHHVSVENASDTCDTSDTLLLLPLTCPPSRGLTDVHESRSRGIKARKL